MVRGKSKRTEKQNSHLVLSLQVIITFANEIKRKTKKLYKNET